jgi:hypothetical protein
MIPVLSEALFGERFLSGESCNVFDIPAARSEPYLRNFKYSSGTSI